MKRWLLAAGLGLAIVLPQVARAQAESARSVSLAIGGGSSFPVGGARHTFRNGFDGSASVRLDLAKLPLTIRAEFMYQNFDLRGAGATASDTSQGTATVLSGGLVGQIWPHRRGLRPYLMLGSGVHRVKLDPEAAGVSSPAELRWGIEAGAGVQVSLGGFTFYAEARDQYLLARRLLEGQRAIELVPLTAGVVF